MLESARARLDVRQCMLDFALGRARRYAVGSGEQTILEFDGCNETQASWGEPICESTGPRAGQHMSKYGDSCRLPADESKMSAAAA